MCDLTLIFLVPQFLIPTLSQTQHLAVASISNYFVPTDNTVNSVLTQLVPRLFVEYVPSIVPTLT